MAENLKLPNEILEPAIVTRSLHDKSFFLKIKKYLDTHNFKNKNYFNEEKLQKIFNYLCVWHDKKHKLPNKTEVKSLLRKLEKDEEIILLTDSVIDKVYNGDPNEIDVDFLEEEVKSFIEETRVYEAFMQSQIDIQDRNYGAIVERIKDAIRVSFDQDLGFSIRDYVLGIEQISELDDQMSIASGISTLDTILEGGFKNQEIYIFAATPGIGKTALLGNFAINAFLDNKKVIVFTLETHRRRLLSRYYSNLTEMTKSQIISEQDEAGKTLQEILENTTGDVIIKDYNANTVNTNDLLEYLYDLELYKEIVPDLIIVDYLLLMQTNNKSLSSDNSYKYYKTVTEELRNLGGTLNVPILSAAQINRHGQDEKSGTKAITTAKDISESRGIYDTTDFFATINQTPRDRDKSQIMIFVDKWRSGENNKKIRCEFDYTHMKISEV